MRVFFDATVWCGAILKPAGINARLLGLAAMGGPLRGLTSDVVLLEFFRHATGTTGERTRKVDASFFGAMPLTDTSGSLESRRGTTRAASRRQSLPTFRVLNHPPRGEWVLERIALRRQAPSRVRWARRTSSRVRMRCPPLASGLESRMWASVGMIGCPPSRASRSTGSSTSSLSAAPLSFSRPIGLSCPSRLGSRPMRRVALHLRIGDSMAGSRLRTQRVGRDDDGRDRHG